MTIPFELRSLIYSHLLSGADRYIISPSGRPQFHKNNPCVRSEGAYVFPAANLLLVNHLLRSEIQTVIVDNAHLYCSLTDFYDQAYCTRQLPDWLRTSLPHISVYHDYVSSSNSPDDHRNPGGIDAPFSKWLEIVLAPPRQPKRAYLRRGKFLKALPSLQSIDIVYFWPEILGPLKGHHEQFFEGKRDEELLSLVKMAFRYEVAFDMLVAERLVSGQTEGLHPEDIPEGFFVKGRGKDGEEEGGSSLSPDSLDIPANKVRIEVTGHFCDMYPTDDERKRRCLVSLRPFPFNSSHPGL